MSQPNQRELLADPATAIQRAKCELDSLKDDSEHIYRLATLGTLAAGIAHEINNILTPALAYAHLAKSNPDDQAIQAKAIEKSISCIETATRIARHVLDFSSQREEDPVASVEACIRSALECLARDPAKDRIKVNVKDHARSTVVMKPLALQQVLLNLLLNACEAMRGRGGTLRIESIDRADGTTSISIKDTGPGIDPKIAGRIFQPFVTSRPSSDASHKGSGSGLGLTICQRLVDQAAGTIAAESTPGSGTTMTLVIPTAKSKRSMAV